MECANTSDLTLPNQLDWQERCELACEKRSDHGACFWRKYLYSNAMVKFYDYWNRVEGYSMSMQLPAISFIRLMQAEDANSEKRHKGLLESRNSKWYVNPRFLSRISRPHTNHTKAATGYSFLRDYSEQLKMCMCICANLYSVDHANKGSLDMKSTRSRTFMHANADSLAMIIFSRDSIQSGSCLPRDALTSNYHCKGSCMLEE